MEFAYIPVQPWLLPACITFVQVGCTQLYDPPVTPKQKNTPECVLYSILLPCAKGLKENHIKKDMWTADERLKLMVQW